MEPIDEVGRKLMELVARIDAMLADTETIRNNWIAGIGGETFYTGEQLCRKFHFSKRALQNYRDSGIIPYTRIGDKILYIESDIQAILDMNHRETFGVTKI